MGAPSFKDCIAADISTVFLNRLEFAETHTVNGKEMAVLVDENELLERDKSRMGTHQDGLYKSRRLIHVSAVEFGRRPALNSILSLDGRQFKIADCTEEAGMFAITLEATKS